jgi:hypothetical protein
MGYAKKRDKEKTSNERKKCMPKSMKKRKEKEKKEIKIAHTFK